MQVLLLGPQRLEPTVGAALAAHAIDGPIAVVTAGWLENEEEDETLRRELGRPCTNVALYRRAEQLFTEESGLFAIHTLCQERLREQQRLYRRRLDHALAAFRELRGLAGNGELLSNERADALATVRALDDHHLERVRAIRGEYEAELRDGQWPDLRRNRQELEEQLVGSSAVAIAGGHVAVLLNRLRLFELGPLLRTKSIVAWGAGAMALASRIVLFHDSPPWGAGNAEVLEEGLGTCPGLLPLPHARRRLRLADPQRVALFAQRFSPLRCVGMDEGARIEVRDGRWSGAGARLLEAAGTTRALGGLDWQDLDP